MLPSIRAAQFNYGLPSSMAAEKEIPPSPMVELPFQRSKYRSEGKLVISGVETAGITTMALTECAHEDAVSSERLQSTKGYWLSLRR